MVNAGSHHLTEPPTVQNGPLNFISGTRSLAFSVPLFNALKDRLLRMTRVERLAVPGLPEHRVDTIVYALIQVERVLLAGEIRELARSRYALKEGAAARAMEL